MGVTWDSLGCIHHRNDPLRSFECYRAAVAIFVDIGDRQNEAESRVGLARTCRVLGRVDEAAAEERLADEILRELGVGSAFYDREHHPVRTGRDRVDTIEAGSART